MGWCGWTAVDEIPQPSIIERRIYDPIPPNRPHRRGRAPHVAGGFPLTARIGGILLVAGGRREPWGRGRPRVPPFVRGLVSSAGRPGDRTYPSRRGLHRCGTVPVSHRASLRCLPPGRRPGALGNYRVDWSPSRSDQMISFCAGPGQNAVMHLLPADRSDHRVIDEEQVCRAVAALGSPDRSRPGAALRRARRSHPAHAADLHQAPPARSASRTWPPRPACTIPRFPRRCATCAPPDRQYRTRWPGHPYLLASTPSRRCWPGRWRRDGPARARRLRRRRDQGGLGVRVELVTAGEVLHPLGAHPADGLVAGSTWASGPASATTGSGSAR